MDEEIRIPLPSEIRDSLASFRQDHPDPNRVAFVMMEFGHSTAHRDIVEAVRAALGKHDISALRADEKCYHYSLFDNVRTYMHGCGFGIAIFERLESEAFNPNVALEVGYMLALQRPVCLLKDRTLKSLLSDLIGHLYREFDPQHPKETILPEITRWLSDRGLGTLWGSEQRASGQSAFVLFRRNGSAEFPFFETTDGARAAMMFRSKERADYFIIGRGFAGEWEPRQLTPSEVTQWLEGAKESYELTEVAIDPDPSDSHYNARVLPISVVIEIFKARQGGA